MADLKAERLGSFIYRLTPSEKRYFRKQYEGKDSHPVYLEIFDYLNASSAVRNEEFDRNFRDRDFMRNPASAINYLEGLLCSSLEQYHRQKIPSLSLVSELQTAKALWMRGFNKMALKRLRSIEKRAERASDWETLSDCLHWKAKAVAKDSSSADMLEELRSISEKRFHALRQQEIALKWETKHVELVHGIFHKGATSAKEHLDDLQSWLCLNAEETKGNFEARYFELWILGRVAKLQGDILETHRLRAELLNHVLGQEDWHVLNHTPYITILTNLGGSAIELQDVQTLEAVLAKLKEMTCIDPDQVLLARVLASFLRMMHLVRMSKVKECYSWMREAISDYKRGSHLLVKMNQAVILYYFAFVNLVMRNYREAHRWLLQIEQEISPEQHFDVVCVSKILRLIAYFETESHSLLKKAAEDTMLFLNSKARDKVVEKAICAYFLDVSLSFETKQAEQDRLQKVMALFSEESRLSFHQSHLKDWTVARLTGKSLFDYLSQNSVG